MSGRPRLLSVVLILLARDVSRRALECPVLADNSWIVIELRDIPDQACCDALRAAFLFGVSVTDFSSFSPRMGWSALGPLLGVTECVVTDALAAAVEGAVCANSSTVPDQPSAARLYSYVCGRWDEGCSPRSTVVGGSYAFLVENKLSMENMLNILSCDRPPAPATAPDSAFWELVLQYGTAPYAATRAAVGVPSEEGVGFAKLSDAAINSLSSGVDAQYNYYMFTSDSLASTDRGIIIRVTGVFDDEARNMGWESFGLCVPLGARRLEECSGWGAIVKTYREGFDTMNFGNVAPANDCSRWFMDYSRPASCYSPTGQGPAGQRCFSHGHRCSRHAVRTNVKMYKLREATLRTTTTLATDPDYVSCAACSVVGVVAGALVFLPLFLQA